MRDLGCDLSGHRPRHVSDFQHFMFDFVAKMDAPDIGDLVQARWMENWDVPDPARGGPSEFRKVRELLSSACGASSRRMSIEKPVGAGRKEEVKLDSAATHLLEECRMVLPGIQALFGFQLIAVFNQAFDEKLSPGEQQLHFLALFLVALSAALVMAPAAIHRQSQQREVSERFIWLSSLLLRVSMYPLALGLTLDVYLIGRVVFDAPDSRVRLCRNSLRRPGRPLAGAALARGESEPLICCTMASLGEGCHATGLGTNALRFASSCSRYQDVMHVRRTPRTC
jgi:hypothetical protein